MVDAPEIVTVEKVEGELDGTQLFKIDSKNGLIIKVISYGASLLSC